MKVFIVDDNAEIRHLVHSIIGDLTEQIFEYDSAENIVAMYELHKPDWIFMDIKMKPLNGITATALLKHKFPEARVVILTNYGEQTYRIAAKKAGVSGFFLKDDLRQIRTIFSDILEPM
ncbi:MAG: response regulator transcription factor [Ignavibacteriales bacterium]|nr:response regulator transcription factor [Ignavibacteriales bacterium]